MKCSAIRIGDEWMDVSKNPVTDSGKKSKGGRISLFKNTLGEYSTGKITDEIWKANNKEVLQVVYENGKLFNETNLEEIRKRATIR